MKEVFLLFSRLAIKELKAIHSLTLHQQNPAPVKHVKGAGARNPRFDSGRGC